MSKTVGKIIVKMPKKHERIKKRAKELFAEDMGLQALRKALKLTQKNLAKKLSIGQEGVSRLEQHSDLMLSTLRNHIEAMGGKLRITAEFPNHNSGQPIRLFQPHKTPLATRSGYRISQHFLGGSWNPSDSGAFLT